jgi:hypothetical protein
MAVYNCRVVRSGRVGSPHPQAPPRYFVDVVTTTGKHKVRLYSAVPIPLGYKCRLRATTAGMTLEPR